VTGSRLLLATRSQDKLREIQRILDLGDAAELLTLDDAGIVETGDEDDLEAFATFEENALAKARHFASVSGLLTVADDSGLCVDALGGAPGVHSKRFSRRADLPGPALDDANNRLLLERLRDVAPPDRTAHYVCAIAVVTADGREEVFRGRCHGVILEEPRGHGGFGYDPLFFLPAEGATFGELMPDQKDRFSHRARAVRAAQPAIRLLIDEGRVGDRASAAVNPSDALPSTTVDGRSPPH